MVGPKQDLEPEQGEKRSSPTSPQALGEALDSPQSWQ